MCILGNSEETNKILLFIVSLLASKIVIIVENDTEKHFPITQ